MRKLVQLFWILAISLPVSAFAQTTMAVGEMEAYIAKLGADCPIQYGEAWSLNSIETHGDTICALLQTPSSLAGFLSMLTGEGDNVKRMWIKQLKSFGRPWEELIGRLARSERSLAITFHPANSTATAELVFSPENFTEFVGLGKPDTSVSGDDQPADVDGQQRDK